MSAALTAIAFSLASTVRGEAERAGTAVDGLRSYYLATGAVERARIHLLWSLTSGGDRIIPHGATFFDYAFPTGAAHVEFLPEAGKMNVNGIQPEELFRMLVALGQDPGQAQETTAAVVDWRQGTTESSPFDPFYSAQFPSFRAPHASVQEIEELLLVKGVTPDLFYGTYVPAESGGSENSPRLVRRAGLMDCLSVYGSNSRIDVNTAEPAVLVALGLDPFVINAIVQRRSIAPMTQEQLNELLESLGVTTARLRTEGNSIITIRATARVRTPDGKLSDLKRTVSAVVKYMPLGSVPTQHILRWYDTSLSPNALEN